MRQCADIVFDYLKKIGVTCVFILTGGGAMYLVDSLGRSGLSYVCCHHEQAAAIAAQAYAMASGRLGVCLVTTGPGGTNALTAVGASFVDSTPVLFISGQVKRADFASKRHVRQFGAQENDIVSMVQPVTKYAKTVTNEEDTLYEIEEAIYRANEGRKGPVWIDIPLDVQSSMLDETQLKQFNPDRENTKYSIDTTDTIGKTAHLLKTARRPLVLAGHGVFAAGAQMEVVEMVHKLKIPAICTWRAAGLFDNNDTLFFGFPGLQAPRYTNFILQACDLLIVLGSRLDNMITAFNESHFAYNAKKIIVDIDANEIKKLDMPHIIPVVGDVGSFVTQLAKEVDFSVDYSGWIARCEKAKKLYPIENEEQVTPQNGADLYRVARTISDYCRKDDTLVVSSTSRCNTAGYIAFKHTQGQKVISSMGFGSMGFAVPSVVGAYYGADKKRVVAIEGDGSLQLNIQELQTVKHQAIPMKLFVFANNAYAAISTMQDRNFDGRHVGSTPQSGVTMPNLEKLAAAYGFAYFRINMNEEIEKVVARIMADDAAVICEIVGSPHFDEIPKAISSLNEKGERVSAVLEDLYPFLPEDEVTTCLNALIGVENIDRE